MFTVDLGLPDSVGDAPQTGQDKEDVLLVGVGRPLEEDDDHDDIDDGAADEDGGAAHVLDEGAEAQRADGVASAVADEHVADVLHTERAGDKALFLKKNRNTFCSNDGK